MSGYEGMVDPLVEDPDETLGLTPIRWAVTSMSTLLASAQAGTLERPIPTIGRIGDGDGAGLLYPRKVCGIAGDSGSGKSWTALVVARDEAGRGRWSIWVDYEDSAATLAVRMAEIGWPTDLGHMILHVAAHGRSEEGLEVLRELVKNHDPSLVVFDSTGEALAADGANPNADEEVAAWFQRLPRPIAEMGPCALLIDHLAKDSGDGHWPIGSQRKRAAINGIQYLVKVVKPFSRSHAGRTKLVAAKDRGGFYAQGETVAEVAFDPKGDGGLLVAIWKAREERRAEDGGFRPTGLMERASRFIEQNEGANGREIREELTGKTELRVRALKVLVDEGYVLKRPGKGSAVEHVSVRPFREAHDV